MGSFRTAFLWVTALSPGLTRTSSPAEFDTIVDFGAGDRLDFAAADIHDLVGVTEPAGGTVLCFTSKVASVLMDAVILTDVHGMGLGHLISHGSVVV